MKVVTAIISKKNNSWWAGRGRVISIDLASAIVLLDMETGREKGKVGGFDLDKVRFRVRRS